MKRTIFFIGGGIILVGLLGFWLYSFLYGSPTNTTPNFTDFSLFNGGDNEEVAALPEIPVVENPQVDVSGEPLRQLTTKPVIGMQIVRNGSGEFMRYAEAGTGHIFDIDLKTGSETRVSQVSVPVASEAKFSQDGLWVAIRSGYVANDEVVLVKISTETDSDEKTTLPNVIDSFAFGSNNNFFFSEIAGSSLVGNSYNLDTKETIKIFSIPFTAATILWSQSTSTPHYALTKPAASLTGYLYAIKGGQISRTPISGRGLTAVAYSDIVFSTTDSKGNINTYSYNSNSNNIDTLGFPTLADKCVQSSGGSTLYCALNQNTTGTDLPDSWYKGSRSFDDRLWKRTKITSNEQVVNFSAAAGRPLDVYTPKLTTDSEMLYFINKIDQTLWIYEFSN